MVNNLFSIRSYFPSHFPIKLENFLPAPNRLYSVAGSTFIAAAIGGSYGLIGRIVCPKAGIIPLHYAVWFAVAFQIKECINFGEIYFENFLGIGSYLDKLERIPEDELDLEDRIRFHCWKVIHLKNKSLKTIDRVISQFLDIRPYSDVREDGIKNASFLEMCRYRAWPVFKSTIVDAVSSALAYRLTHQMRLTLPAQTAVPLFIVIRSIVKDIILIPAMHVYARFCNQLADEIGEKDKRARAYRVYWIYRFLPAI